MKVIGYSLLFLILCAVMAGVVSGFNVYMKMQNKLETSENFEEQIKPFLTELKQALTNNSKPPQWENSKNITLTVTAEGQYEFIMVKPEAKIKIKPLHSDQGLKWFCVGLPKYADAGVCQPIRNGYKSI